MAADEFGEGVSWLWCPSSSHQHSIVSPDYSSMILRILRKTDPSCILATPLFPRRKQHIPNSQVVFDMTRGDGTDVFASEKRRRQCLGAERSGCRFTV